MSDIDILREIEKELGIKFEEISKDDWDRHIENGTSYSRNKYYFENENILLIAFRGKRNISQKVWDLKFLSEIYFRDSNFDKLPTDIGKLKNLRVLSIINNESLKSFPVEICELENLEILDLSRAAIQSIPPDIGKLKKLKKMDISGMESLKSFPVEICELENLEILDLSRAAIQSIPPGIGKLKKLKKMDISGMESLKSFPVEICELENLEILDLRGAAIQSIPPDIGKLKKLKDLNISSMESLKSFPVEICGLENLEILYLSGAAIQSIPPDIGKLKKLKDLYISSMESLKSFPVEICELENLEILYLSRSAIQSIPPDIGKLKKLKKMDISGINQDHSRNYFESIKILPIEIGYLEKLQELSISSLSIEKIPNEIGNLKNLRELHLSDNKLLTSLPLEIGKLKNLKELTITQNNIRGLPQEIGDLENIEELDLSKNSKINLEDIAPILSKLKNSKLRYLNLSGYTYLNYIPKEIILLKNLKFVEFEDCNIATLNLKWEECGNLQKLYLSNNKISDLEPLKDLKNIEEIDLSGNKDLISIPEALLNIPSLQNITIDYLQNKKLMEEIEKNDKDVIKGAKEYYRKKRETLSQIQKQVKVILIGDGNSGKTSLLRRLLLDGFSDNSATTHGIRLEEDYFEIGNDKVKIKYWDMGGQDVYHSPHSFFFSDNTIYLLVLDARKEEAPEYWMEQIKTYGNSADRKIKSPVLVVVNKIDAYPSHEIDISRLEENVELIGGKVFEVSAFENKGIKEVEKALHDFIEAQLKDNTRLINKTGEQYKDLTRDIYNLRYDTIFKDRAYLKQEEFAELLNKNKLLSQKDVLVKELQELGAILSFPHPKIKNPLYVYKPEWLIDKIYHLFKVAKNEKAGMIDILDLPKILDCKESQEIKFIQSIIEKVFELAFTKSINGESFLFIPDALPYKKEIAANTNRDNTILIQVKFPNLNRRIISNCMIEFSKKLSEQKIWKTGMVLKIREEEIIMEALEEERMISFQIPNSISKDGLVFIQNSLTAIEGDNLNFPKTSIFVQVPPFIIKDLSKDTIECMVDVKEAEFYWNQTEEIRSLYFPSLGITMPIPLDEVLKYYGINIQENRKINSAPTIIINANDNEIKSIEDLLANSSEDFTAISQRISAKLKESASDSYNESKEKLKYWITDYNKVTEFSREALVDAFYLYETIQKFKKSNYTAVVFQLARAFEQEMEDRIFRDFISYCSGLHNLGEDKIILENYSLNAYKSEFAQSMSDFKEIPDSNTMKGAIGTFRTAINSDLQSIKYKYDLNCIVYTLACSHLMKDDGNLLVRYFKKFLNEKFHYERIGNNEFAASIIELKELRNKAAHKGTHFNEEQGKLVWKKMTYFFQDWTRALKA